ncbi:hypothetical protein BH09ACT6_BH09ACT6_20390 [soil metagenome]
MTASAGSVSGIGEFPPFLVEVLLTGSPDWPRRYTASVAGEERASGLERFAIDGSLSATYPSGAGDRELAVGEGSEPDAVAAIVHTILSRNPRCRRVVTAAPVGDLAAIALAEEAGFRYVVDVDTHSAELSLLVAEPEWVLALPSAIEDIPL